ncbi:hypothetical protein Ccrd_011592 [Cynara cardunculus var. scolymus]|uniref:DUF7356 domain-containing protein n=1 Tax=Cynara cardunculus var. scolymus TaxID=59895 RepID=A0A103YJ46_CYNCS|nr:hypothetical protein Ccrd_011592 [Cynara cardunculus var. scolymus]
MIRRGLLIITILIVLPLESYALSPLYSFRHLYEQSNASPSPSPSNGVDFASGGTDFQHYCNRASRSCQLKNIAACLTYFQDGVEVGCTRVNNHEAPLHVKIMILPANNTIKEIDLPSHGIEKIKIFLDVESSSAIALNTRDGDCVIRAAARAPAPENHFQKYPSYTTYITPQNGAYLVILLVIVGGTLTCFKSRIQARHLDRVPYHELEMGNSPALSSQDLEDSEVENWDQDWDDEWGDEKPVKSGGENPVMVKQANGLTAKLPNSDGRRKEWDD